MLSLSTRKSSDIEGLLNLLDDVFSDSDTNGENGINYLSESAKTFFESSDIPEDMWSDNYYMHLQFRKQWDESINNGTPITEMDIIENYANWFIGTNMSYYQRMMEYQIAKDESNEVIAIAFAGL